MSYELQNQIIILRYNINISMFDYTIYFLIHLLLQGEKTPFLTKQFTEFILVVESSSNSGSNILGKHDSLRPSVSSNSVQNDTTFSSRSSLLSKSTSSSQRTGKFQLLGDVLTRFSDHCTNTVTQTSSVAKSEIQVIGV